jgi:hypothetical protein
MSRQTNTQDSQFVMPGLVPGIYVFLLVNPRRGWPGISAFTRVFNALCPAMTWGARRFQ